MAVAGFFICDILQRDGSMSRALSFGSRQYELIPISRADFLDGCFVVVVALTLKLGLGLAKLRHPAFHIGTRR
jgi:hypothetical protein